MNVLARIGRALFPPREAPAPISLYVGDARVELPPGTTLRVPDTSGRRAWLFVREGSPPPPTTTPAPPTPAVLIPAPPTPAAISAPPTPPTLEPPRAREAPREGALVEAEDLDAPPPAKAAPPPPPPPPPRPRPLAPPPSPPRNDRVAGDDDDDEEEDAAWDDAVKRDPHIKKEGETSRGLKRKSPEPEAAPTQPESPRSKYVGSKYVGVYNQGGTTWRAQHSNRYLGMFQTELEAAEAYAKAAGLREPLIKRNGLSGLALLHDTRARERVAAPPERDASNERVAPTESATGGDDSATEGVPPRNEERPEADADVIGGGDDAGDAAEERPSKIQLQKRVTTVMQRVRVKLGKNYIHADDPPPEGWPQGVPFSGLPNSLDYGEEGRKQLEAILAWAESQDLPEAPTSARRRSPVTPDLIPYVDLTPLDEKRRSIPTQRFVAGPASGRLPTPENDTPPPPPPRVMAWQRDCRGLCGTACRCHGFGPDREALLRSGEYKEKSVKCPRNGGCGGDILLMFTRDAARDGANLRCPYEECGLDLALPKKYTKYFDNTCSSG